MSGVVGDGSGVSFFQCAYCAMDLDGRGVYFVVGSHRIRVGLFLVLRGIARVHG